VERNACEVSARCHDEQASFLALNRMHGIVTGARASRRGITTGMSFELSPHMEQLRLSPCDAARQSAPFDEIKYAKLHARLSDPRLQREKIRLPFFLIFSKGNYRTYEC
jgi:hypothetical protein